MHHLKVKNEEKILGGGPQREIPYTLDPTFNFGACSAQSHSAAPYRAPTQPPDFPPPIIVLRHGRVFCAPQKKTHSYPFSELGMSEFAWDSRVRTVISQGGGGYSLYIYIWPIKKIFVFQVTRPTHGKNPRLKKVYGTFGPISVFRDILCKKMA